MKLPQLLTISCLAIQMAKAAVISKPDIESIVVDHVPAVTQGMSVHPASLFCRMERMWLRMIILAAAVPMITPLFSAPMIEGKPGEGPISKGDEAGVKLHRFSLPSMVVRPSILWPLSEVIVIACQSSAQSKGFGIRAQEVDGSSSEEAGFTGNFTGNLPFKGSIDGPKPKFFDKRRGSVFNRLKLLISRRLLEAEVGIGPPIQSAAIVPFVTAPKPDKISSAHW